MAKCLRLKRPVSDYQAIETLLLADLKAQGNLVGRNDPCPCGSGRKFKKCCNVAGEHYSTIAEREGFEPSTREYRALAFQASSLSHSDTSPA